MLQAQDMLVPQRSKNSCWYRQGGHDFNPPQRDRGDGGMWVVIGHCGESELCTLAFS